MRALDVMVVAGPLAIAAALSYWFRHRGAGTPALVWLAGVPILYVTTLLLGWPP